MLVFAKEWLEKFYTEAMVEHGLTREEAEILEPEISFVRFYAQEAKRCGITSQEVQERYEVGIKNPDPETVMYCENIIDRPYDYADQFIENSVLDSVLKEHLNRCGGCNGSIVNAIANEMKRGEEEIRHDLGLLEPREAFLHGGAMRHGVTPEKFERMHDDSIVLRHGGKDCFTAKERIIYAREGGLSAERMDHTKNCIGCERMIKADREEFLAGAKITGVA